MVCFSSDWLPGPMRGVWALVVLALLLPVTQPTQAQSDNYDVTIARVQYGGGGDWYTGSQTLSTLLSFVREHTLLDVAPSEDNVELSSSRLYQYPVLYLTGHGNVFFSEREARALRRYLEQGGFLHIDDDYGLDEHIRREMQKVFPNQEFVELPFDHPIYRSHYRFPSGLPKVHEHDGAPPQGFGLFDDGGRLAVFYSYEADLGNGWDPPDVHGNPPDVRRAALQMGTNILVYALTRPSEPNANAEPAQEVTSEPRTATES